MILPTLVFPALFVFGEHSFKFIKNLWYKPYLWLQDIHHNDIQHNGTQHNNTQHNAIQHNDKKMQGILKEEVSLYH